jgi:hypothetical protein
MRRNRRAHQPDQGAGRRCLILPRLWFDGEARRRRREGEADFRELTVTMNTTKHFESQRLTEAIGANAERFDGGRMGEFKLTQPGRQIGFDRSSKAVRSRFEGGFKLAYFGRQVIFCARFHSHEHPLPFSNFLTRINHPPISPTTMAVAGSVKLAGIRINVQ